MASKDDKKAFAAGLAWFASRIFYLLGYPNRRGPANLLTGSVQYILTFTTMGYAGLKFFFKISGKELYNQYKNKKF
jgi:hypothetical protein